MGFFNTLFSAEEMRNTWQTKSRLMQGKPVNPRPHAHLLLADRATAEAL
jgi:hypothetical protein